MNEKDEIRLCFREAGARVEFAKQYVEFGGRNTVVDSRAEMRERNENAEQRNEEMNGRVSRVVSTCIIVCQGDETASVVNQAMNESRLPVTLEESGKSRTVSSSRKVSIMVYW